MFNILLMHYFGGAGGKFISNCLSLSGQVAFPNYQLALDYQNNKNIKNLEQALLDTIPPRAQSKTWLQLEQGCQQLFGNDIISIRKGSPLTDNLNDINVLKYDWLPLVSHDNDSFNNIKQYFNHSKIFTVFVSSTQDFIDYAIRLKWPEEHHCLDLDQYKEFNHHCKFLDFDYTITEWDPRNLDKHQEIVNLAICLNINYNPDIANDYIHRYLEFHQ
jgi:hypothetical protein